MGAVDEARRGEGGASSPGRSPSALNPLRTASASSSCAAEARIEQRSGGARLGPDMDSSSVTGWEEFGRSHPARTALNLSQPSRSRASDLAFHRNPWL